MRYKLFVAIALLLGGCTTKASYIKRTNQNIGSYQGRNIQEVITAIGYYTRSFEGPNGRKVYAWETSRSMTTPQTTISPTQNGAFVQGNQVFAAGASQSYQVGGVPLTSWCNAYFVVDENEIVVDWQWQGNGC